MNKKKEADNAIKRKFSLVDVVAICFNLASLNLMANLCCLVVFIVVLIIYYQMEMRG